MADKATWAGASGTKYDYFVYDLDWSPNPDQDGNYIFARIDNGFWKAVYIGEGDIAARKADHLNNGCVTLKGASHFLCHLNSDGVARRYEEGDLLASHQEAYAPTGCNEKIGG